MIPDSFHAFFIAAAGLRARSSGCLLSAASWFGQIARVSRGRERRLSTSVVAGFVIVMAVNAIGGIALIIDPNRSPAPSAIAGAAVPSLSLGIERARELVGGRRPDALTSIQGLLVRKDHPSSGDEQGQRGTDGS